MDELNKENGNINGDTPETTAETTPETTAETTPETIPETTAETNESADPYGGIEKEYFEAPLPDAGETAVIKASKRTTAVLISIITVLVAVIVVFVFLFLRELKANNEKGGSSDSFFGRIASIFSKNKDDVPDDIGPDPVGDNGVTAIPTGAAVSDPAGPDGGDVVEPGSIEYNVTVTLGQYKGVEVDYEYTPVTDEDVEDMIDAFLEDSAEETEITDRPAQLGDVVLIDYTGYIDDEPFEGGADTDFELELGSGRFIPGFEEGLVGANAGDTVDLNISFPDPYLNNEELSGKPVKFVVDVHEIYSLEIPELTDELVAENTEYATVAEYRDSLRAELEADAREEADETAKNAAANKVVENCKYEGDIDKEIENTVAYWMQYYDDMYQSYYGMDAASMFAMYYGWTAEEYEQFMTDEYTFSIKYSYALKEIAAAEGLEVTEEEYEGKFEDLFFDYYGFTSREEVLEAISEEEIDDMVRNSILQEKAEKVIMDNAVFKGK